MFPNLGVGVGLRGPHYQRFLVEKPRSVSWVEVISENFMEGKALSPSRALQALERVREDYPLRARIDGSMQ